MPLRLSTGYIEMEPGQRETLTVTVRNLNDPRTTRQGEQYTLFIEGLEPTWYTLPEAVFLMPGDAQPLDIEIHPPAEATTPAQAFRFRIGRQTRGTGETHRVEAQLVIRPFASVEVSLEPEQQKVRREGRFKVNVQCRANAKVRSPLRVMDPEGQILTEDEGYELDPELLHFESGGGSQEAELRVRPRRPWIGRAREQEFEVESRPEIIEAPVAGRGDVPRGRGRGKVIAPPRIPWWLFPALLAALTYLFWPRVRCPVPPPREARMVILGSRPSQELRDVKGSGQELIPYFTNGEPDILDFGEVPFVRGDPEATGKRAIVLALHNPEVGDPLRETLRVYGICACILKGRKDFEVINRPESLTPGQVDIVKIVFHPTRLGVRKGLLRITCSDPKNHIRNILLQGEGVPDREDRKDREDERGIDRIPEAEVRETPANQPNSSSGN